MNAIEERVRRLFGECIERGADTDAWGDGPEHVEALCYRIEQRRPEAALHSLELVHDPVWDELRSYLQGLTDAHQLWGRP